MPVTGAVLFPGCEFFFKSSFFSLGANGKGERGDNGEDLTDLLGGSHGNTHGEKYIVS